MIKIIDKNHCTGCGACMSSCPKSAISMRADYEGFDQPIINQELCIDCGLCQKVCPPLHYIERHEKRIQENSVQKGIAARNRNYKERLISSSGGIFPVLAKKIISDGGIVVGVAFDDNYNSVYKIIDNLKELHLIQGSKYLQCKADISIFKQIQKQLKIGRTVLFSGLACQIEGLRSFLRNDFNNLICVDLICMGIPSAIVWQKYLKTYFAGEKIKAVNFKEKSVGWNHFNLAITTNKQNFKQWGMINPYFKSMFNTYNMRQSCFVCPFKNLLRAADITLADCWGANKLASEIDDNKGLSSVIIHSQKGANLWDSVSNAVDKKELSLDVIVAGNKNMVENRTCNIKERTEFYNLLNAGKIKKAFHFAEMHGANAPTPLRTRINGKIRGFVGTFYMHLKSFLNPRRWRTNKKLFHELYDYDLKFNASFRGKKKLNKQELSMPQIRYLWYYRKAQSAKNCLWYAYYLRKLVKFSEHTGIMLYENMNLAKGLIIGHPGTIIINGAVKNAGNLMLTHGVTIGRDIRGKRAGTPTIGKDVCIRCNSTVVGGITIGDDVLIAPNTFVNFDVPSHSIVIGNPATIHHKDNATEGHIGKVE